MNIIYEYHGRKECCQNCKNIFWTDSPHHDVYCGDCRIMWVQFLKEMR